MASHIATEGLSLEVKWLQQALVPPQKPAVMQVAELAYATARTNRRAASKVAGRVAVRDFDAGAARPGRIAERFMAELAVHDATVKATRVAFEERHMEYEQSYLAQVEPTIIAAEHALTAIIDLLDSVVGELGDANTYAESNRLRAPALMSNAPRLQTLIHGLRSILANSR